jgi:hypothetical protein
MKISDLTELHRLFDIAHGNKFDLNKMTDCAPTHDAIAFVGRSGEDNGIVGFVERFEDVEPYGAGLITVALGGAALSSFVQPRRFYTAQNIDVLKPRMEMCLDVKLYYCLCIEANRFRYSTYGREANRTLRNLLLPKLECVPNWVAGTSTLAVDELSRDLSAVVGNQR